MIAILHTAFQKKPRRKPWIFYCAHCRQRVSTATYTAYYRILGWTDRTEEVAGARCCSQHCAEAMIPRILESVGFAELYPHQPVILEDPDWPADYAQWLGRRGAEVRQIRYHEVVGEGLDVRRDLPQ